MPYLKKIALSALALAALASCSKIEPVTFTDVPPELADCKFFHMSNLEFGKVLVSRCPNSTTTTKARKATSVIESGGLPADAPTTLNYRGQTYIRAHASDAVPE